MLQPNLPAKYFSVKRLMLSSRECSACLACERLSWFRGLGTRYLSNMADQKLDQRGSALVILAEGAEEMEAVITTDVLRRGKVSLRT